MSSPQTITTTRFNLIYFLVFTPLVTTLSVVGLIYMVSLKAHIPFSYSFQLAREAFGL